MPNCPPNVRIVDISYLEYCQKVSEKLSITFQPENPYKLCDIKPALGFTHAEELQGYDFWGFGDLDLDYGDLRQYFTPQRLANKDVFSTHSTRISGHLCLLRNTDELRSAFNRVKDWQKKFMQSAHLAFDEKDFSKIFLRHKNSPRLVQALSKKWDAWLTKAEFNEAYTTPNGRIAWMDGSGNFPTEWVWEYGKLACNRPLFHEIPYFHFLKWKYS